MEVVGNGVGGITPVRASVTRNIFHSNITLHMVA
jgi:hypothetical protein